MFLFPCYFNLSATQHFQRSRPFLEFICNVKMNTLSILDTIQKVKQIICINANSAINFGHITNFKSRRLSVWVSCQLHQIKMKMQHCSSYFIVNFRKIFSVLSDNSVSILKCRFISMVNLRYCNVFFLFKCILQYVLITQRLDLRATIGSLGIRIVSQSGATCLPSNCSLSQSEVEL